MLFCSLHTAAVLALSVSDSARATHIHVTHTHVRANACDQEKLRQRGLHVNAAPDLHLKRRSGSLAGRKMLTDSMKDESSIVDTNPKLSLSLPDYIAHEILLWAQPGSCVSSSQVRLGLRHKLRLKGNPELAVLIKDRITALVDAGVVKTVADDDVRVAVAPEEKAGEVEVEVGAGAKAKPKAKGKAKAKPKAKGKTKAKRGRKNVSFEKCSWVEVSARPQALAMVTRLKLTADNFHSH